MPRIKKIKANKDGWCDWQYPIMDGYRMSCCDCGLTHTMQFRVIKLSKEDIFLDSGVYRVALRAKRNNRSTANLRKKNNGKIKRNN
jgi:hypothetical protein